MGPKKSVKWGPIPFHTLYVHLACEMGSQFSANFPVRKAPLTRPWPELQFRAIPKFQKGRSGGNAPP